MGLKEDMLILEKSGLESRIKELEDRINGLDAERTASNVRYIQAREYLKEACELIKKGAYFSGHYTDCDQANDDEECTCGAERFEFNAHIFLEIHAR